MSANAKKYDVVSICNALVDILIKVEDHDIEALGLTKGIMHLVDEKRQGEVLHRFSDHETTTELGGSSLNAIRTLASLGCRTSFAGMVGQDRFGTLIADRMKILGIDAHLGSIIDATGTCLILITPDGERTMNTNLGASRLFSPSLVPEATIAESQVFHFCGYQWDTDGQIATIERAIDLAKDHGVKISFDVADPFVILRHRDTFLKLIKNHADIVFSNKEEARMLYGTGPEEAALAIAATGAVAVVKKGGEGAVVASGDQLIQIPPVPTKVIDTTAAGDMFAAGFLYGMVRRKSLAQCGQIATMVASDVISRVGATVSGRVLEEALKI